MTHGPVCRALLANHARAGAVPDHFDNRPHVLDPDPLFAARLVNCKQHPSEGPGGSSAEELVR